MKCVICKSSDVVAGKTTVVLERNGCAVVFREVPAEVCSNCGESYVSDEVTSTLLLRPKQAIAEGAELQVVRFAA